MQRETRFYPGTSTSPLLNRGALIALLFALGCGEQKQAPQIHTTPAPDTNPEKTTPDDTGIERIDDVAMVPIDVAGFSALPLETKKHVYYHYLAALAGDRTLYAQRGPKHLAIKQVLEGVLSVRKQIPGQIREKIEPYAQRFWFNHGNYDVRSGAKILPTFIPGELAAATQIALDKGIDLGIDQVEGIKLDATRLEQLEALLQSIRPWVFDSSFRSPNTPTDGGSEPDVLSTRLTEVAKHLRKSLPMIKPAQKEALGHLIEFFETGDKESYIKYDKLWLATKPDVETIIDLSSATTEPDSDTGSFGAIVAIRDKEITELMRTTAEQAAYYEQKMPWDVRFKRSPQDIRPFVPDAFQVIVATGELDPLSPTVDRPLIFTNVLNAVSRVRDEEFIRAFSPNQEVEERRRTWHRQARTAHLVLREVIGRNAGKVRRNLRDKAALSLKEYARTVEEMGADLAALYLVFDPQARESGLIPNDECARAIYDTYASAMLEQLSGVNDETAILPAHMSSLQTIVQYATNKGAMEIIEKEGHFFARVIDYEKARAAVGELLGEIQQIKTIGNYARAKELIDVHGMRVVEKWWRDVQTRVEALSLPPAIAFLYPLMRPIVNEKGATTDFDLSYPDTYMERQLYLAGQQ